MRGKQPSKFLREYFMKSEDKETVQQQPYDWRDVWGLGTQQQFICRKCFWLSA